VAEKKDPQAIWLPVIGKALAYLCLSQAIEKEPRKYKGVLNKVKFLQGLGLTRQSKPARTLSPLGYPDVETYPVPLGVRAEQMTWNGVGSVEHPTSAASGPQAESPSCERICSKRSNEIGY
jgi:hypothetical protein